MAISSGLNGVRAAGVLRTGVIICLSKDGR